MENDDFSTNYSAGDKDSSYKLDPYSDDEYDQEEVNILTKILNKTKKQTKKIAKPPKKIKIDFGDENTFKRSYNSQINYYA